jgi:AAA+ ATPase superfamily predicted ATPase
MSPDYALGLHEQLNDLNSKAASLSSQADSLSNQIKSLEKQISGGFALSDVPYILGVLSAMGLPNVEQMLTEYNELKQLKKWLDNENAWLQSEGAVIKALEKVIKVWLKESEIV